jgi:hypothetical protein
LAYRLALVMCDVRVVLLELGLLHRTSLTLSLCLMVRVKRLVRLMSMLLCTLLLLLHRCVLPILVLPLLLHWLAHRCCLLVLVWWEQHLLVGIM